MTTQHHTIISMDFTWQPATDGRVCRAIAGLLPSGSWQGGCQFRNGTINWLAVSETSEHRAVLAAEDIIFWQVAQ